jgi:PAS domain S-box-containing protein
MDSIYPEINNSLNVIFQENPQPMWLFDLSTLKFLIVNQAALQHYGYSRDEFLTLTVRDIRPLEDVSKLELTLTGLSGPATTRRPFRHLKKDLSIIDVGIISFPVSYQSKHARLVMTKDFTETTSLPEQIDLTCKATNEAIWDLNMETNELWWNKSFKGLFGDMREILRQDIASWANRIHPEDRGRVLSSIREAIAREQRNRSRKYRFLKEDGEYVDVIDRGYAVFEENKAIRPFGI